VGCFPSVPHFVDLPFGDPLPTFLSLFVAFQACGPPWGIRPPREAVQTSYNSSQQELEELRAAALEVCQEVEEGVAQAGSSLASRLRALSGHVSQRMHRALHLGIKKALGVVVSHYQVDFEALKMRWRWTARTRSPPPPLTCSQRTSPTSCS
jgi:hypothetical protein